MTIFGQYIIVLNYKLSFTTFYYAAGSASGKDEANPVF